MDQRLKTARMDIASEIGADIGNFTPPEEETVHRRGDHARHWRSYALCLL